MTSGAGYPLPKYGIAWCHLFIGRNFIVQLAPHTAYCMLKLMEIGKWQKK